MLYCKIIDSSLVNKLVNTFPVRSDECHVLMHLPHVIVSDNGPGFASSKFGEFLKSNGVRHMFTAPYHPSSNGQADRMVLSLFLGI